MGDVIATAKPIVKQSRLGKLKIASSSAQGQILGMRVWEREKTELDKVTEVNSLVDPNDEANSQRFTVEFWAATATILSIAFFFGVCIVLACVGQRRPKGMYVCMYVYIYTYICI